MNVSTRERKVGGKKEGTRRRKEKEGEHVRIGKRKIIKRNIL